MERAGSFGRKREEEEEEGRSGGGGGRGRKWEEGWRGAGNRWMGDRASERERAREFGCQARFGRGAVALVCIGAEPGVMATPLCCSRSHVDIGRMSLHSVEVKGNLKERETLKTRENPAKTSTNQQKPVRTSKDQQKPARTSINQHSPRETPAELGKAPARTRKKPAETRISQQEPAETKQDRAKSGRNRRSQQKSRQKSAKTSRKQKTAEKRAPGPLDAAAVDLPQPKRVPTLMALVPEEHRTEW